MVSMYPAVLMLLVHLHTGTMEIHTPDAEPMYAVTLVDTSPTYPPPLGDFYIDPTRVYPDYFSREYHQEIHYAMFFHGGYAIHETTDEPSHGCIHVSHADAPLLWYGVKRALDTGNKVEVRIEP